MADRQSRQSERHTAPHFHLPAWLNIAAPIFAAAIAVAIVVTETAGHPGNHALGSVDKASTHHALSKPSRPSDTHRTSAQSDQGAAAHDPTTATTQPVRTVVTTTTPSNALPASSRTPNPADRHTSTSPPHTTTSSSMPTTTTTSTTLPPSTRTTTSTKVVSGTLAAPFLSATFPFHTASGAVNATTTWSATAPLHVTLRCAGAATAHVSSSGGIYLAITAHEGACTLTLSEPNSGDAVISYNVAIDYQQLSS